MSSHVEFLLFLSRVARPDILLVVQRLCGVEIKLTTTHDAQLIRLYAYLDFAGPLALRSELSREDLDDVQFVCGPMRTGPDILRIPSRPLDSCWN